MNEEIIKPTFTRKPDFITGIDSLEFYIFECLSCGGNIQIDCKTLIGISWTGKGESLSEEEFLLLKKYYGIGIANKSREGRFPVFDKVRCGKCQAEYYTYIGIEEARNSVYHIKIQGIIKKS